MASFNRPRFPGPMFNPNIPRPGFNMNFRSERPPMQTFQRVPNPSFRPFQFPDRFPSSGSFQNRPRFSNFPDHTFSSGLRDRPAALDKMPHINAPRPGFRPRFSGPFEPTFRPWNQRPTFAPPRQPFQNRPRAPVPPLKSRNSAVQANKKRRQKTREFRKLKDNNKEKPFSCDTCDRAFATENELNEHLSQHVKCDITNCKFEAHPKIVALHQKMQHETGYADVINKLQDTEEIKKWREERRKNFPTAENIQKRKAEQAEKEARGEVLETKEFGKFKRRKPEDGSLRSYDHGRKRIRHYQNTYPSRDRIQNHPFSRPFIFHIDSESDSDSDSHITLKQFPGLSSLTNSTSISKENNSSEDGSSVQDKITSSDPISVWNQNEHNFPNNESDNNIAIQNVLRIDGNASNVKDLDQTTNLLNNKLMERETPKKISNSLIAVETITEVKDIGSINRNSENRSFMAAEDSKTTGKLLESSLGTKLLVDVEDSEDEGPTVLSIIKSTVNEVEEHSNTNIKDIDNWKKTSKSDKRQEEKSALSNESNEVPCTNNKNARNKISKKSSGNGQDEKPAISNGSNEVPCAKNVRNENSAKSSVNGDSSLKDKNSQNNDSYKWPEPVLNTRKSTLLEKLLADDIRHERNVILQCIRHIVNNNYFGIGQK